MSLKNPATTVNLSARHKKNRLPRWVITIPFAALAVGGATIGAIAHTPDDQFVPGVQVAGIALGKKSDTEARALLSQLEDKLKATVILIRFAPDTGVTRSWKLSAGQLGLGLDASSTLEAARKAGRKNLLEETTRLLTPSSPIPVSLRSATDTAKLQQVLKQIGWAVNRKPKDASVRVLPGGALGHKHDVPGLLMDVPASMTLVENAWSDYLAKGKPEETTSPSPQPESLPKEPAATPIRNTATTDTNLNAHQPPPSGESAPPTGTNTSKPEAPSQSIDENSLSVTVAARSLPAKITFAEVSQMDGLLASFASHYGGISNRLHNVEQAAKKIDGVLIRPGDIFSYNDVVGPRDLANGFREAPEIVQGRHKMGIGGGVCQVSSTLYNTVLRANLKVIRRSHHATPIGYLPTGCDATVVYGAIDFQFQNNTDTPILISTSTDRSSRELRFRIFGKERPGRKVTIERSKISSEPYETIRQVDTSLRPGRVEVQDSGHSGHRVTVTRVVEENGQVTREVISNDHYQPVPEIVRVGAKPRPVVRPAKPVSPGTLPTNSPAPIGPVPNPKRALQGRP